MDPYQVLGISRDASPEEIKKAYRTKAKQYHPDLHPDDPSCTEKMNQINEAYDRLTHPEKYKDIHQGTGYGSAYGNQNPYGNNGAGGTYGNYQNGNGYGNYQNGNGYGNYQNGNGYGNYRNGNGYGNYQNGNGYGGFWTYNDIFGFGSRNNVQKPQPQPLANDPQEIINIIYYFNNGQYEQALGLLNNVISSQRGERWYYLSALVNFEAGQKVIALEHIKKAMQMNQYNQEYKQAYLYMNQSSSNYQNAGSSYNSMFTSMGNICLYYMLCNCFCMFCH